MKSLLQTVSFAAICACTPVQMAQPSNVLIDMGQIETFSDGRCFANDISPAVIETVTIQEIESPEVRNEAGQVIRPAAFRTVKRQQIVRERAGIRFETVCPQNYTVERVSTLQRALKARGFYNGPISGTLDPATGAAIQQFQRLGGPDTVLLSIDTARKLGVIAFDRAALEAGE
jgi:hypothetical protein